MTMQKAFSEKLLSEQKIKILSYTYTNKIYASKPTKTDVEIVLVHLDVEVILELLSTHLVCTYFYEF